MSQYPRLEAYVKGVVGAFKNDPRILAWDIWNEPDNANDNNYGQNNLKTELPKARKIAIITALLPQVFQWARAAGATQPLTSGVWIYRTPDDWQNPAKWSPMEKVQFETFRHHHLPPVFRTPMIWKKSFLPYKHLADR